MVRGLQRSIAVLVFPAVLASCSTREENLEACHWIGSVNPLTGGLGPVGLPLENAAKLAVQDINLAGEVAGKPLCIATGDDRTDPQRAAKVVDALVDKHDIRALNGAAASSASLEAAKSAAAYDMAMVSCCSTSPALTLDPKIYRTVPSDALQGVALANYAAGVGQAQNVAIIYLDNTYGSALKDQFVAAFTGTGGTVARTVKYQERQSSYVTEVNEALSTAPAPDHVILIAYPVEGIQIVRDWRTSGVGRDVKWLGTDGLKDDAFALGVGDMEFSGTAPIPNGVHYAAFSEHYQETYGGELPGIFTSNQYDAVILIALGIAAAGPQADRAAIRAAIPELSRPPGMMVSIENLDDALDMVQRGEDVDYAGVSGDVDIDENGDVLAGYRVWNIRQSALEETSLCFRCNELPVEQRIECTEEGC